MAKQPQKSAANRLKLIQLDWSPLRFFVLVILVIEAAFVFIGSQAVPDKFVLFVADVGTIIAVVIIFGLLAYLGVFNEKGHTVALPSYKLFIEPSEDRPVDMSRIVWDESNCHMRIGKSAPTQFTPAYPHEGGALEVIIPSSEGIDEYTVVQLQLVDNYGNIWDVLPFRLWQIRRELRPRSNWKKIVHDYSDEDSGQ
jgi:hypothetical protein